MTKNTELKLICKVADVIERLSERNQDLLLFRYKHNYSDDLIADLMAIPKEEVSQKINHAKLLVAMSLFGKNIFRPVIQLARISTIYIALVVV